MAVQQSPKQDRTSISREVSERIHRSLHTRTATPGTARAKVEGVVKTAAQKVWTQLRKRPSLGVLLVGGAGIALATVTGVGELTIGIAAAYGAYQVLRQGVSPDAAVKDVIEKMERLG
jgi:hypothetical protein